MFRAYRLEKGGKVMKFGRTLILTILLVLSGVSAFADECNSLRYADNGDGTVTDCRTGLIWLKNASCAGSRIWYDAMKWVAALNDTGDSATRICELSDGSYDGEWRLPTITELRAMIASAKKQGFTDPIITNAAGTAKWTNDDAFTNVQSDYYWSSISFPLGIGTCCAWALSLDDGSVYLFDKPFSFGVWPVRGGQIGTFGTLFIE